ncbi:MAG TPA: DUF1326 domain-containing protein [Tepidisphaeraceae bacterium]|nr:DUF1326 domain-containing protein [Tepidisphaeraceae bacterium]
MRMIKTIAASLVLLCSSTALAAVKGDYVEVRTASVFAGACHYNGELVTTGRDAILAWKITEGEHNGVNLAGVKAVAVVSSDANLSDDKATRKSEILIDGTDAQMSAWTAMLKEQSSAALGEIVSVKRGTVTFNHDKNGYTLDAAGFASAKVQAMPDGGCCKQPNLVWYEPLTKLTDRKVGYTATASYAGGKIGTKWDRANENSAFYGSFTR